MPSATTISSPSPGTARRLFLEAKAIVQSVLESPRRWPVEQNGFRRWRLENFPYSWRYEVNDADDVHFVAFVHAKRRPGYAPQSIALVLAGRRSATSPQRNVPAFPYAPLAQLLDRAARSDQRGSPSGEIGASVPSVSPRRPRAVACAPVAFRVWQALARPNGGMLL